MPPVAAVRPVLRYREVTESMMAEHAALSIAEYHDTPVCDVSHLTWKYCRNPQGPAYVYELRQNDELIGRVFLQPRWFFDGDRQLLAGNLVDLLIHPAHRGMAAFVALMRELRTTKGFDFLYFTPNSASMALYRQVLKFPELRPLSPRAALLGAGGVVRKLLGERLAWFTPPLNVVTSLSVAALTNCLRAGSRVQVCADQIPSPNEFESFVAGLIPIDAAGGVRSFAMLSWRFLQSPLVRYNIFMFRRDGVMCGYAVCRHTTYERLKTTFVLDLALDPALPVHERAHARAELLSAAQRAGSEVVFSLATSPTDERAFPVGFPLIPVPTRVLPQETPVFYVDLTPDTPKRISADRFLLSPADLDIF